MFHVSLEEFESIVDEAVSIISKSKPGITKNVAFLVEEVPSEEQRKKLSLLPNQTLYGLYEGLPLPRRQGQSKILPDKITIFKIPIENSVNSLDGLVEQIRHTIWHEVAHYYGLNHEEIYKKES